MSEGYLQITCDHDWICSDVPEYCKPYRDKQNRAHFGLFTIA